MDTTTPAYYPVLSAKTGMWHVNCNGIRQAGRWVTREDAQRAADKMNRDEPSAFFTARKSR